MTRSITLTAVFEEVENGWVQAQLQELPEVLTCAPTHDEAKEMLIDAFNEYLLSLAQDAQPVRINAKAETEPVALTFA